jgi:phosphohistidine phosphatase
MKTLTVIRHAKSNWDQENLDDFDRPLAPRGRKDIPRVARALQEAGWPVPDRIVSSPAVRALATAEGLVREMGRPASLLVTDERIYLADLDDLLEVIQDLDDRHSDVFLVGHNPGMADLVTALGRSVIPGFPTCAVARFEFPVHRWSRTGPACGRLVKLLKPKSLT